MEAESGAKIAIRGKGSVKEGKGRSDAAHSSNQEEDLHCLIMADTEDKINKAKQLIHNVIETVRLGGPWNDHMLTVLRPRQFQRVRTTSSETSSVNLLRSTAPFETTKTRPARTAVRLVIGSMTAPRGRTSLLASSAECAATRGILLGTVPIVSAAAVGATMWAMAVPLEGLVAATLSTGRWR